MRPHKTSSAFVMSSLIALCALAFGGADGVSLAGCTNTASTEPGDPPQDAGLPSALGNGFRIAQLNAPTSPVHPVNGQMNVQVTGATYVVTDTYAETGTASSVGAIYVQDFSSPPDGGGAPPYSGIELYKSTFLPADLGLAPGDVIDFSGEYQEYDGVSSFMFPNNTYQPEMYEPIVQFRFDYGPPTPTPILMKDLTAYSTGFPWMSMLVIVNGFNTPGDLVVGGIVLGDDGRCGIFISNDTSQDQPYIDNELFALPCGSQADGGVTISTVGTPIKSVTGIVTYFGSFTLSPRNMADIVLQ